jgi:hypothetical protein
MSGLDRPKLRPVEAIPIEVEGRRGICLRDPFGLADNLAVVFEPVALVLAFFDGRHTLEQASGMLQRLAGLRVGVEALRELAEQLEAQCLLHGPRAAARRQELLKLWRSSPTRPASLAGTSYPAEPEALGPLLDSYYLAAGGPGSPPDTAASAPLAAALAPHVDLGRGGPVFAHTYRRIAQDDRARRFVVLGTGHSLASLISAAAKDFETPLGTVRCDRSFLERLQERLDFDLAGDELAHRSEHSIEFQALYLARLFAGRREVTLVPILCGSFHEFVEGARSPSTSDQLESFVAAMRETLAELADVPTCVLGAVDLSHVGPYYGDEEPVGADRRRLVEQEDRRLLGPVVAGDAEGFFRAVAADGDRRRICGLSSIYLLLRCVDVPRGELLAYAQANDAVGTSIVSFASVVYPAA